MPEIERLELELLIEFAMKRERERAFERAFILDDICHAMIVDRMLLLIMLLKEI